jgi:hypothetical protein
MPTSGRECTPIFDRLPRRGRGSLPGRRCGRSCPSGNDTAANSLPGGHSRRAEEKSPRNGSKASPPDYHRFYWQRGYGAFSVSPCEARRPPRIRGHPGGTPIAAAPFRKNTASSCANTASSRTNVCVGLKQRARLSRAFSARSEAVNISGALPQAGNEAAPFARANAEIDFRNDGGPRHFSRFPSNFFQKCLGGGPGAIYFAICFRPSLPESSGAS